MHTKISVCPLKENKQYLYPIHDSYLILINLTPK